MFFSRSQYTISQNALHDPRLIDCLIARSTIAAGDLVFDLGAGRGAITARLARHGCQVVAVEADPCLFAQLHARLGQCPGVELRCAAIADLRLPRTPFKVFANLPFNATADTIRLLTEHVQAPDDMYLVVQREAAERFSGLPRSTLVAALLVPWFEPSIVHRFHRGDFTPVPRVDVVMLRLRKRGPPLVPCDRSQAFRDFVVALFTRQDSVLGSLKHVVGGRAARAIGRQVGLERATRPSNVAAESWPELFAAFDHIAAGPAQLRIAGAQASLRRQQRRLTKVHRTRRGRPAVLAFGRAVRPGQTTDCRPPPGRRQGASRNRVASTCASACQKRDHHRMSERRISPRPHVSIQPAARA